MQNGKKRPGSSWAEDGILRYLRFAILPLIVIILIIVIMKADSKEREDRNPSTLAPAMENDETGSRKAVEPADGGPDSQEAVLQTDGASELTGEQETESQTQEPENGAPPASEDAENSPESQEAPAAFDDIDISQYQLKQDEVPELFSLVQTYCDAKEACDPQALFSVFGITSLSEEAAAEEHEKMELVKASIKGYKNISCYSIEGPEADTYVIFPYFEIQYREAETLMPVLTWGYARKNAEGQYIMTQEVSEAEAGYISRIAAKEDVRSLMNQVSEAQKAAVDSDETLKHIYSSAGSQVTLGGNP